MSPGAHFCTTVRKLPSKEPNIENITVTAPNMRFLGMEDGGYCLVLGSSKQMLMTTMIL
jgi:hypothetical protein